MSETKRSLALRIAAISGSLILASAGAASFVFSAGKSWWLEIIGVAGGGILLAVAYWMLGISIGNDARERLFNILKRLVNWTLWIFGVVFTLIVVFSIEVKLHYTLATMLWSLLGVALSATAIFYITWQRRRDRLTLNKVKSKRAINRSLVSTNLQSARLLATISESLSPTSSVASKISAIHEIRSVAELSTDAAKTSRDMLEVFIRQEAAQDSYDARSHYLLLQLAISSLTSIANRDDRLFYPPDLSGLKLDHLDLQGLPLAGINLAGASLVDADLGGADLSGANLARAQLVRCKAVGTRFRSAILRETDLTDAILAETDFSGALMTGVTLTRAQAESANFSRALLNEATLADANLTKSDLSDAMLVGSNLAGTSLKDAILSNTAVSKEIAAGPIYDKGGRMKFRTVRNTGDLEIWLLLRSALSK